MRTELLKITEPSVKKLNDRITQWERKKKQDKRINDSMNGHQQASPSSINRRTKTRAIKARTNKVEVVLQLPNTMMTRYRRCVIRNAASATGRMATKLATAPPRIKHATSVANASTLHQQCHWTDAKTGQRSETTSVNSRHAVSVEGSFPRH